MTDTPQRALAGYLEATNTHDFDRVAEWLSPHAVYFFGDRTCRNPGEIRAYFESAWATVVDEHYEAQGVEWLSVSEAAATAVYRYVWSGLIEGTPARGQGRATNVFELVDGRWQLVHEHLSRMPG